MEGNSLFMAGCRKRKRGGEGGGQASSQQGWREYWERNNAPIHQEEYHLAGRLRAQRVKYLEGRREQWAETQRYVAWCREREANNEMDAENA